MGNRYEQITAISGPEKGETSIIMAGVHGKEIAGINALNEVMQDVSIESGTVIFCYGNPRAIEQNSRYVDANLNSMFRDDSDLSEKEIRSYEYERAQVLKPYLLRAGVLLDLHTMSFREREPFLITEPKGYEIARHLPFDIVVSNVDQVTPGGTDHFMNHNGRIGICAECGFHTDENATIKAIDTVNAFLAVQGHIDDVLPSVRTQRYIRIDGMYIAKGDFVFEGEQGRFDSLPKGTLIGRDGGKEVYTTEDGQVIWAFAGTITGGNGAFMYGQELPSR
jgi:succinylglutamate desuccinylase